jgi:trehalose 6-phosphate synthase
MENPDHNPLVVFANREPYIHVHSPDGVEVHRPASGLVSALEPVLQHRGGLWIAHGSGSADAEHCDLDGRLDVPPHAPRYQLKRVWLTPSERRAYYDGFSNEALWPLFHIAHHQPIFRKGDWEAYTRVNERFAQSLSHESLSGTPSILVQDFHLALVPRMLRKSLALQGFIPRIGLVWHIPWVPSDVYRICPWAAELLIGILGADLVTFHTQSYCNNFLECCERLLECRVDRDRQSVTYHGHETRIRAVPIGIDPAPVIGHSEHALRSYVRMKFGIEPEILAVGVDRLDYTKGIPERLQAIERFLDQNPSYVGRFSFLQIASPSRTDVPAYRTFAEGVQLEADRINARFEPLIGPGLALPIRIESAHHDWDSINMLYQAADVCLVTSLHDGMNLVAKEYAWSKRDDSGALILSRFTGASTELQEAYLVNPYDIDDMADVLRAVLSASAEEKRERMRRLRERVSSRTAQSWADEVLETLAA